MPQQQDDMMTKYKKDFNIAYTIALIHQRAIIVPLRKGFGVRALAGQCFCALVLMCMWAALTKDGYMWLWIAFWFLFFLKRRVEALKLAKSGTKIHSEYDGWPDAIRFGRTEKAAKLIVEPLLMTAFGGCMFWIYTHNHLSPYGLPYFMMAAAVTLPFVEIVKQQIWERRKQAVMDARVEQEALMRDLKETYRDF